MPFEFLLDHCSLANSNREVGVPLPIFLIIPPEGNSERLIAKSNNFFEIDGSLPVEEVAKAIDHIFSS